MKYCRMKEKTNWTGTAATELQEGEMWEWKFISRAEFIKKITESGLDTSNINHLIR